MKTLALFLAALALAGCGHSSSSEVAIVSMNRITENWPKFINYNNQLNADAAAIERSSAPESEKQQQRDHLRQQYVRMQEEVTGDVRNAAQQVANKRNFKLVVTGEFAAYGGTDIKADVEKVLNITERASPSP